VLSPAALIAGAMIVARRINPVGAAAAVLNATGSHLVASRHPDPWLNESDLQQVADFVISSHRE
jgi:hypothetical protein